jgi:putative pre-16S rRNA nuclease
MSPPIVAALDLGRRRIGVAISDPQRTAAYPVGTIARGSLKHDLAALAALLNSRNVGRVVVGLPLNMDGSEGPQARQARAFADQLADTLRIPVELYDERLTSFEAEERLKHCSLRGRAKRGSVDAVAAAIILEGWLQERRSSE